MVSPENGRHPGPVLLIFAHPDDEAFGCAGTIAALGETNVPVVLVTATRGEAGEISSDRLATPVTLGAVRERELRAAMALVGVDEVRVLGYRDSGMEGTAENDDARSLHRAPFAEVVGQLTAQIRDIRPAAIITFGADGIYGHPDHIAVHRATVEAVKAAADEHQPTGLGEPWQVPALYFTAVPRERIQAMAQRSDGPFRHMSEEQLARLGTPADEITTRVDVVPYRSLKEQVIRAHQTQVGEGGPMADMPKEQVEAFLATENFVRVALLTAGADSPSSDPLTVLAERLVPAI